METIDILDQIKGLTFVVLGPFLVTDLQNKDEVFNNLPIGKYGMEKVGYREKTDPHIHAFASFYKSEGLDVEHKDKKINLPEKALTLVLPGVDHNWISKKIAGAVGSVDFRHEKQVVMAIA